MEIASFRPPSGDTIYLLQRLHLQQEGRLGFRPLRGDTIYLPLPKGHGRLIEFPSPFGGHYLSSYLPSMFMTVGVIRFRPLRGDTIYLL